MTLDVRKPCRVAFPLGIAAIIWLSLSPSSQVPDPGTWDKLNHVLAYLLAALPAPPARGPLVQLPRSPEPAEQRKLRFPGKPESPRPAVTSPFARQERVPPPPAANEDAAQAGHRPSGASPRGRYRVTISRADGRVSHLKARLRDLDSAAVILVTIDTSPTIRTSADRSAEPGIAAIARKWALRPDRPPG